MDTLFQLARTVSFAGAFAVAALVPATAVHAVEPEEFIKEIEKAHNAEKWYSHDLVRADMTVEFQGEISVDGTATFDTVVGRSRFDLDNGTVLVFDGEHAWVSPADAEHEGARFNLLTWPYFLAAPMKLSDPGTNHEYNGELPLRDAEHPTVKLTFDEGVGDAPDDWYVLYRDPESHRLQAMSYIVTYFSGSREGAEPHAIYYDDYTSVDGVQLSRKWTFYHWSEEEGVHGEPIGEVQIENIEFIEADPSLFEKPEDAREDKLPTGS